MREIFINGMSFRYKTERDLGIILRSAKLAERMRAVVQQCQRIRQRELNARNIKVVA